MLKLAVLSDFHLGFGHGTERYEDAFTNASLALEIAAKNDPNLILIIGDIFHEKIAKPEVLARSIELFTKAMKSMKAAPTMTKRTKDGKTEELKKTIPPILVIWGTHEHRNLQSINPVQLLEKTGLVYCLHGESIQLAFGYDKLGIHGLSGVPEQFIKGTFKAWNPQPFSGAFNIMMLHQNFKELLPVQEEEWLGFPDLPKGFDLFLLGHFHANYEKAHPQFGAPILVPGSTVATQINKSESQKEKGFYLIEIGRQKADAKFITIPTRPSFYEKIDVSGRRPVEIAAEISAIVKKRLESRHTQKPVMRIKLEGTLAEGFSPADLNFSSLMNEYSPHIMLTLDKANLKSSNLEEQSKLLQEIKDKRISLDVIGLKLLRENIKENISLKKLENIFNFLIGESLESAESAIMAEDIFLREEEAAKIQQVERKEVTPVQCPKFEPPKMIMMQTPTVQQAPKEEEQMVEKTTTLPPTAQKRQMDPNEIKMGESGLSMLGASSGGLKAHKSSSSVSAPKSSAPRPFSVPAPQKHGADPTITKLAETGLSMLGASSGPKKSASKPAPKPMQSSGPKPPVQISKPVLKPIVKAKPKFDIDEWLK